MAERHVTDSECKQKKKKKKKKKREANEIKVER
jgi:hypothetical protein